MTAAADDAALLPLHNHPSSPLAANASATAGTAANGGAVHGAQADMDEHGNRPHLDEQEICHSRKCDWNYVLDEIR